MLKTRQFQNIERETLLNILEATLTPNIIQKLMNELSNQELLKCISSKLKTEFIRDLLIKEDVYCSNLENSKLQSIVRPNCSAEHEQDVDELSVDQLRAGVKLVTGIEPDARWICKRVHGHNSNLG